MQQPGSPAVAGCVQQSAEPAAAAASAAPQATHAAQPAAAVAVVQAAAAQRVAAVAVAVVLAAVAMTELELAGLCYDAGSLCCTCLAALVARSLALAAVHPQAAAMEHHPCTAAALCCGQPGCCAVCRLVPQLPWFQHPTVLLHLPAQLLQLRAVPLVVSALQR